MKNIIIIMSCMAVLAMQLACKKEQAELTVKDIDGNVYKTIKIGDQIWMAENLKVTHYNDGAEIPLILGGQEWENFGSLATGAYCYYDKDANKVPKYGLLYNSYAVETGKLAPKGWHVPSDEDWQELRDYLIANGYNHDGTFMENMVAKSLAAVTDWVYNDKVGSVGHAIEKNNKTEFNAFPSGYRTSFSFFDGLGFGAYFWSSSESAGSNFKKNYWRLEYDLEELLGPGSIYENSGLAIRCVKD